MRLARPQGLLRRASLLHIKEDAWEAQRGPIRPLLDAPVSLDPVIASVRTPDPVLVRIGPASRDGLGDCPRQTRLVV